METRSEKYLRFSRRSMVVTLLVVLAVGGVCVGMAIRPASSRCPRAAHLPAARVKSVAATPC